MTRPFLLSAILLLAGCARSEEARYAQVENMQLPAVNAAQAGDDDDLAVGTWQSGLRDDQTVLEFGPVGAPVRFSLGCDARRNLLLLWPGAPPGGDLPNMLVQVGSENRRLPLASTGGANPTLRGALAPNDPFVRVLSEARTRIVVRIGDAQPLIMPPSPAIAPYAQQCAGGAIVPVSAAAAGNNVEASGSVNVVAGNAATANAQ